MLDDSFNKPDELPDAKTVESVFVYSYDGAHLFECV